MGDEMKIRSTVARTIVSKIVSKVAKNKLGSDCDILINEFALRNDGDTTGVKLDIDIRIETSKIPEVLNKLGIM